MCPLRIHRYIDIYIANDRFSPCCNPVVDVDPKSLAITRMWCIINYVNRNLHQNTSILDIVISGSSIIIIIIFSFNTQSDTPQNVYK